VTITNPAANRANAPLSQATKPSASSYGSGDLQAFQAHISERIVRAQSEEQKTQALLSVDLAGYRLLLRLTEISELLPVLPVTTIALAKRWITGLAVARSEVVVVFDLAYCLDCLLPNIPLDWRKTTTTESPNKGTDHKCIVLATEVAPQAVFVAEKVYGALTPQVLGHHLLARPENTPSFIVNIWQDLTQQVSLELSLSALLQSQDFNTLTY
jgi:chemotaxis signal transduction protein